MKHVTLFLLLCVGLVIGLFTNSFALGSPEKAKEAIAKGAVVIDVRSPKEFAEGHLDGALNIPHSDIAKRIDEIQASKSDPIVVYCAVGGRASIAQTVLKDQGFENVINGGGYKDLK